MKSRIAGAVALLQPGERLSVPLLSLLSDPGLRPSFRHNGVTFEMPDNVLEQIQGSSYTHSYRVDHRNNHVVFFRLEESLENDPAGRRSYVSPDRRSFYRYDGRLYTPREAE